MIRSLVCTLLTLCALLAGCAGPAVKPTPVATPGSATAQKVFPYSRSAAEAVAEIHKNVAPLMVDKAAEKYRDEHLAGFEQRLAAKLNVVDTPEARASLEKKLVNELMKEKIKNAGAFTMTKVMSGYSKKNALASYSVRPGEPTAAGTPFTGNILVGQSFCYYNSSTRQKDCNDEESYQISVDGVMTWAPDASLDASWKLAVVDHKSSIGLDSTLSENLLHDALASATTGIKSVVTNYVDGTYSQSVKYVSDEITKRLARRIDTATEQETLKESTYQVNFETAVSRIQRRNDKFKFDRDASTFTFNRTSHPGTFAGKAVTIDESVVVKLFPEKSSTVVQFDLSYTKVTDNLTGEVLYGKEDAAKRNADLLGELDKVLKR